MILTCNMSIEENSPPGLQEKGKRVGRQILKAVDSLLKTRQRGELDRKNLRLRYSSYKLLMRLVGISRARVVREMKATSCSNSRLLCSFMSLEQPRVSMASAFKDGSAETVN